TPLLPGTQSQPMNQSSSSPEDRSSSPDVLMSNSSSKSTPVSVAKKKPKGNDADASSSAAADLHGSVGTPAKAGDTVSSSVLSPAAAGSAVPGGGASGGEGVGVGVSCRSSGSGVGDGVGADVVFHDALSGRKMTQLKPPRDGGKLLSSPERRSSSHARSNFARAEESHADSDGGFDAGDEDADGHDGNADLHTEAAVGHVHGMNPQRAGQEGKEGLGRKEKSLFLFNKATKYEDPFGVTIRFDEGTGFDFKQDPKWKKDQMPGRVRQGNIIERVLRRKLGAELPRPTYAAIMLANQWFKTTFNLTYASAADADRMRALLREAKVPYTGFKPLMVKVEASGFNRRWTPEEINEWLEREQCVRV